MSSKEEKSKVIPLQPAATRAEFPLPRPFAEMRDRAWTVLADRMHRLLDKADDALFELADRALNANEQNLYFEAMREVRVKRTQLEQGFAREITEGFRDVAQSAPAYGVAENKSALELLEYEDMEEQVAVESMASKAEKSLGRPLTNLSATISRIAKSMGREVALTEKNLPLGPLAVCRAFAIACQQLDIDIKPRLVLFKMFDRHVVSELPSVYARVEEALRESGQWVEAEVSVQTRPAPRAGSAVSMEVSGETAASVFDILKALAQQSRGDDTVSATVAGDALNVTGNIQISKTALIAVLQDMQHCQLERLAVHGGTGIAELPVELAERLQSVGKQAPSDSEVALAQRDFDIINLVALLFQYILEDANLAPQMKGLIGFLQIPVLKVAMVDKSFFSKEGHPARTLLNKIADACIGWVPTRDCEDEPLYLEIEGLVKRILGREDGSTVVFQDALEEFEAYLEKEQRRAELVTQRMLHVEGSRKAADAARAEVDRLLKEKIEAQDDVPPALQRLLLDGWSKVLFLHNVQQGTDSTAWSSALTLADRLLWSVQPVTSTGQRDQLLSELPSILEGLRNGLNQVGFNPFEMKELLHELEVVHLDRLKRIAAGGAAQKNNDKTVETEMQGREAAKAATAKRQEDTDLESLDAALAQTLGESGVAIPAQPSPAVLAQSAALLAKLRVGTWVEFAQGRDKKLRCKLAAVIASTGKHIFVNRSGVKVAEHGRDELVTMLATDQLVLLDDGLLFDRALESVISNLRDMKDKPI